MSSEIAPLLLPWFEQHGRKHLPWQQQASGYQVWLSEIMLQQTQVNTVIPYYERFIQAFPTLDSLAKAELDQVLQHWAGLGYYARARNLHKAATIMQQQHQSALPQTLEQLIALPGIGRSTAGAILSLAYGQFAAILDGNVKRVLSRLYRVSGWTGQSSTIKQLWALAEKQTPREMTAKYNQAMMDLGSMVCVRSRPVCQSCPLTGICQGYLHGNPSNYPQPKPKKSRPLKQCWLLLHRVDNQVLLEKRPPQGIWGGLWSLPELEQIEFLDDWQQNHIGLSHQATFLQSKLIKHQFSHFDLWISLADIQLPDSFMRHFNSVIREQDGLRWINIKEMDKYGLPAPVLKILTKQLAKQ